LVGSWLALRRFQADIAANVLAHLIRQLELIQPGDGCGPVVAAAWSL